MFLLDTNTCIKILNGHSDNKTVNVITRLKENPVQKIALCSVVKFELWYGAYKSQKKNENLLKYREFMKVFYSFDFDDSASIRTGEIRALLEKQGKTIGPFDTMIAGIALSNELTLVTDNTKEFERVPGIKLENWTQ